MPPVANTPARAVPAGLGRRSVAKLLDALIVGLPLAGVRTLAGLDADAYLFTVVQAVAFLAYGALMESSTGATLGKRALKLTVRAESGTPPDLRAAIIRNLYWAFQIVPPPALGGALSLAAWLGIAVSISAFDRHRGYHDHLAGTSVFRTAGPHPA